VSEEQKRNPNDLIREAICREIAMHIFEPAKSVCQKTDMNKLITDIIDICKANSLDNLEIFALLHIASRYIYNQILQTDEQFKHEIIAFYSRIEKEAFESAMQGLMQASRDICLTCGKPRAKCTCTKGYL
jgi:hypothetical protein